MSFDDLTFMEPNIPDMDETEDEDETWDGDRTVIAAPEAIAPELPQEEIDFFTGDQAVGDEFGGGFDDMGGMDHGVDHGMDPGTEDGSPAPEGGRPSEHDSRTTDAFDPRRPPNEKDLVMAMADEDGSGMMDYFDQTFLKNWAGPEHWKLRKVVRKGIPLASLHLLHTQLAFRRPKPQ